MEALRRHVRSCRDTAGVGTRAAASAEGVHPSTWNRFVSREGWVRPYEGVAIAPWASDVDATVLAAVCLAHGGAAAGATARWRHGLGPRPRRLEVVVPHGRAVRRIAPDPPVPEPVTSATSIEERRARAAAARAATEARRWHARCRRVRVTRSRWLRRSDVTVVDGVPTLDPVATALSLAATAPDELRSYLVDARQAGRLDLAEVGARLTTVDALRGRHRLVAELEALEGRRPESMFHDEVLRALERLGYRPELTPRRLETPHGRTLTPDVPLPEWLVAIELDGDRFHRDRDARRRDRDRLSAYASIDWAPLVVDHRTWTQDHRRVLADLDAAILAQVRRGVGSRRLPPHLAA